MFPRELSTQEHTWLEWLLPTNRDGYRQFREKMEKLVILGEGRWGANDFILGRIGQEIDMSEGMHPTFAFGYIKGEQCDVAISIHEPNDAGQIEMQLSPIRAERIPFDLVEKSRWTYSQWKPGDPCPATNTRVRQIAIPAKGDLAFTVAISAAQKVLWLYNPIDGTNHLIPVTNFYNELMIIRHIRDPKIALDHKYLFEHLNEFSDEDIINAFIHYNVLYRKVNIGLFDQAKQNRVKAILKRFFHS